MSAPTTPAGTPSSASTATRSRWQWVAVGSAAAMSVLYLLIFAGVTSVGRADEGELGVLGVAGAVYAVFAILLWRLQSRALWIGVALFQLPMTAMYVAIAPERDPSFELWGITLRVLGFVLAAALVLLFVEDRRRRRS